MNTVNHELLRMAREQMAKAAVAPPGGGDPAAAGAAPPADPAAAAAMDPNAMAAVASAPMDMGMNMSAPVPAAPAPAPAPQQQAPQQKLKPEQMMQMIDYRMYNMQQQLTAIMNALGVQLPPEAIVLPPGSTTAPAPETALPGGPGAPAPAAAPAGGDPAAAAQLPSDVYAGQDPAQSGGAVQPIPPAKAANWWQTSSVHEKLAAKTASLQEAAEAALALYRSRKANAG